MLVERTAEDDVAAALAFARSHAGRSIPAQEIAVRWALNHPVAARLAAARPGPALVDALDHLAVADAPSEDLLEAVGAWDRLAAWVAAGQARVLQELHRRSAGSTWAQKGLLDEVAGTLGASGRAARVLMDRAIALGEAPEVHDALREGLVSVRKADVLLRDTGTLTGEQAREVHDRLLPDAPLMTAPQLSAAARRAVLEIDPEAAQARHEQARRDRCVVMEPSGDCMATISAFLPAVDAVRVMRGLDTIAAIADPDDPRGIDARRADALVDVLADVLEGGRVLRGPAPDGRSRRRRQRAVKLSITVSADALAGASNSPAELDGYGPVLPDAARQLAREAAWHFQRTDPVTGEALEQPGSRYRPPDALRAAVVARDVTCTFPGCRVAASTCDLDHTIPFDGSRDAAEQTCRSNLAALCRHHHNLKTHGGWAPRRDAATGITVWTSRAGKPYSRAPVLPPGDHAQGPPAARRRAGGAHDAGERDGPPAGDPPF
ncbi:hypothetical protein N866_15465 [Actinotalea ferrariae CF5-4]|uniref:HNH nuclease domain-containing protein n=1 Tax=Actinotalea ferrariae CF5-4 TaxID=948458 RepID=A0A021VSN1_9CELL|nr:hypothetical protein N866_15465 [Actinotalea ferrariae CF5-4]